MTQKADFIHFIKQKVYSLNYHNSAATKLATFDNFITTVIENPDSTENLVSLMNTEVLANHEHAFVFLKKHACLMTDENNKPPFQSDLPVLEWGFGDYVFHSVGEKVYTGYAEDLRKPN